MISDNSFQVWLYNWLHVFCIILIPVVIFTIILKGAVRDFVEQANLLPAFAIDLSHGVFCELRPLASEVAPHTA